MARTRHVNAPLNYRAAHKGGALVRSNNEQGVVELVGQLALYDVASVAELVGRSARIIMPCEGWISEGVRQFCGVEVAAKVSPVMELTLSRLADQVKQLVDHGSVLLHEGSYLRAQQQFRCALHLVEGFSNTG